MFDFASIPELRLSKGKHGSAAKGTCFMEAIAFFEGLPHSDKPECACPVLTAYGINLNDQMSDAVRNELLRPLIPLVAGTRDPGNERRRAEFLAVWTVNKIVPIALRSRGFDAGAWRCEDARSLAEAKDAANAAAAYAAYAAYAANDANEVWQVTVEGFRKAIELGRHDGFASNPAVRVAEYRALVSA